ncbi:MAG: type II secretion system F family protein [Candidatus Pacearchaeota archaeon]
MKLKYTFILIGIVTLFLSIIFLEEDIRNFLIVMSFVIGILPLVVENAIKSKKEREKEEKFLEFIRDILENVKSGTPITKSILNVQNRDYGVLSPYIKKLSNQLALSFPLSEALNNFSKEVNNDLISRTVELLMEANRSGGEIVSVLSSIDNSISQIQMLKKERKSLVFSLQVQGYIIFLVFMAIILILNFFLIPKLVEVGEIGKKEDLEIKPSMEINFSYIILIVVFVEAIFSGLIIGKIAEGRVINGIKHSFILTSLSLIIFFGAKLIFS